MVLSNDDEEKDAPDGGISEETTNIPSVDDNNR